VRRFRVELLCVAVAGVLTGSAAFATKASAEPYDRDWEVFAQRPFERHDPDNRLFTPATGNYAHHALTRVTRS
jgi:hypothetical protein